MKAMTRISSITRRDIQMMTSPNEDDAKRSKSLSDMPTDMTVDIESLRKVHFRSIYCHCFGTLIAPLTINS